MPTGCVCFFTLLSVNAEVCPTARGERENAIVCTVSAECVYACCREVYARNMAVATYKAQVTERANQYAHVLITASEYLHMRQRPIRSDGLIETFEKKINICSLALPFILSVMSCSSSMGHVSIFKDHAHCSDV